jgi:predicted ATP-dependent protease
MSNYSFGYPSRVTATAYLGKGGVADIERQADLGGRIHTKGILILNGLLGERYGRETPLSVSASLTFEQSYEEVEGDSASAAEFIALLSAITEIPLRQDIAITGSINQHGEIQAIGGVNKKIEGFFTTCKADGFSGKQGVIIPTSNEKNLMLNNEIIEAVRNEQFHVWSIKTIDEGIHLLSGLEPGERQADGSYPEDTFNNAVILGLEKFSKVEKSPPENLSIEEESKSEEPEDEDNA